MISRESNTIDSHITRPAKRLLREQKEHNFEDFLQLQTTYKPN